LDDNDLFSKESASIFGLTKDEIVLTGITGGAIAGAAIDLVFAGHTVLLGGVIGAAIGGAGAFFGFDKLSEKKILGSKIGDLSIKMGPMKNRNFPYILLGRSLYHLYIISHRSHAKRESIVLDGDKTFKDMWLKENIKKELEKSHKIFRSGDKIESRDIDEYSRLITDAIRNIDSSIL